MTTLTFTIPSVLNHGKGEKKLDLEADNILDAFVKACGIMGDDFKRRVLEANGTPRSLINVYINGKNAAFSGGLDAKLTNGDDIYILPAVAGGSDLSKSDLDRYSRQVMLEEIGYEGQLTLGKSRVCVVGVGGLGHPIITRLVSMGVGTVRIVDRDIVELSNLHRQTLFDESDVGKVKVEAAASKLQAMNSSVNLEVLPVSVNDGTAFEVIQGCDVVIDALDSVNARYSLNKACVQLGIPFVTGAAVGVSGQAFTILPKKSACYFCLFPSLDESSMPTCSLEGVHPPILSIVGAVEVAECVKILLGQKPSLSDRILHIDLNNLDFTFTKTIPVSECPVCGNGKSLQKKSSDEFILEELCGRNGGKRTFSITPWKMFDLDSDSIIARAKNLGFTTENLGDLGLSLRNNSVSVNFLKRGSAVTVGSESESDAILLYKKLLDK